MPSGFFQEDQGLSCTLQLSQRARWSGTYKVLSHQFPTDSPPLKALAKPLVSGQLPGWGQGGFRQR